MSNVLEDPRPVVVTVSADVANTLETVQQEDPALVDRALRYLLLRKRVFDVLAETAS